MRKRSIVAPLLLIGIGALLLARNLYPDLALAEYIANYWPYLLIGWGLLRLVEVIIWTSGGKPLPRRGVSGGEWVLVVFLVLLGTGFNAAHNLHNDWSARIPWGNVDIFNEHYDYPVQADHSASPAPHITIEDFRGDVTVKGVPANNGVATNAVMITGRKSIGAVNKMSADEANDASLFEIVGDDGDLKVKLRETGSRKAVRISAALEITVPKGASISAKRRDGNVHVTGVDGAVDVAGRGADVDVEDVSGPVSVEGSFTGSVRAHNVSKAMNFKGRNTQFTVEKILGDLSVDAGDLTATDLVGPMKITSRSNDLRLTGFTNALDVSLDRGDLRLEPGKLPLGAIHVTSRSGDVHLALPEGAQFTMNASTISGDISNDFGSGLKVDKNGPRQALRGSIGSGPEISIDTRRGDITITKTSGTRAVDDSKVTSKKDVLEKIEQ